MNQAKLAYTLKAEDDLETISEYIANDSITHALVFINCYCDFFI
jgi:plasmid stabilization system protein ParE